jgi:uncharacterized alkaline shock family protein YloU
MSDVLGRIEIAPEVLQTISGLAATQVEGVIGLGGGVVSDLNQFFGRKNPRQGIKVEVGEETAIEVSLIVKYGYHIPDVGREVQEKVKSAVESMTGIPVDKVVVRIEGVKLP